MKGIDLAVKMIGLHEERDNKKLRDFFKEHAKNSDIAINPALVPWCSAIMNAWERAVGQKGTGKLNARSWLLYGTPVDIKDAQRGDLCIFKRTNSPVLGHITYFNRRLDKDWIECVGGNQSDKVTIQRYPVAHLLGIRRSPSK